MMVIGKHTRTGRDSARIVTLPVYILVGTASPSQNGVLACVLRIPKIAFRLDEN